MANFTKQYNKVEIAGETIIDLSSDTVAQGSMLDGVTAHDCNGASITGSIQDITFPQWPVNDKTSGYNTVNYIGSTLRYSDSEPLYTWLNIPPGYSSTGQSYAINKFPVTSVSTPATTITSTPTITFDSSTGVVTATNSASDSITPTGTAGSYVTSISAGTVTVDGSDTYTVAESTPATNQSLPSGSTSSGTINRGTYIKIPQGYIKSDKYYLAQADAHSSYTPSSTYFQTSTTGAVSGAKITANAYATSDYYVKAMTLPTAAITSGQTGTNKATLSRSTSTRYIQIPTGYNTTAAYYTISAVANMTLPTATSSTSSGTAKLTVTPGTSDKYINIPTGYNSTASYYTISGDADLLAENIKKDKEIFGVTGTFEGAATCTTRSGGATWANAVSAASNSVGWREEKYSDGRLVRYAWDFWNANAGDGAKTVAMTATASDGSGPTAFVGTPEVYFYQRSTGSTAVSAAISLSSWSNTTHTYYVFFSNNGSNRRIAVSTKMEGYWQ